MDLYCKAKHPSLRVLSFLQVFFQRFAFLGKLYDGFKCISEGVLNKSKGCENGLQEDDRIYIVKPLNNLYNKKREIRYLFPPYTISKTWKDWQAILDPRTCKECSENHGAIYHKDENPPLRPYVHPNCRCKIDFMKATAAGNATNQLL